MHIISVNGEIVKILNIPIGNVGSVFESSMNMAAHVSKAVKSANYHLPHAAPGIQVFARNCTLLSAGNAERVYFTMDTEIHIQELTLRADNQHENLR